jgi:hypothetical protein
MSIRLRCPACRKGLRVPDHLAGRRVTCPRCEGALEVPPAETLAEVTAGAEAPAEEPPVPDVPDWPWPSRFGLFSAGLGLLSVLVLCLPEIGYVAIALSGVGLLLGLWALAGALMKGTPGPGPAVAGGGVAGGFGARAIDLPLAGVAASSVALILALLPILSG